MCRCVGVVAVADVYEGRHPEVGPDQYGASAHRVSRRVMAAAHVLHYGVGIPVRRVPTVLRALTGVELSQSGSPRTHCAVHGGLWEMGTTGFGSLCVIARKVSHCSRNEAGADAFSAFTSVIRTLARHGGGQPAVDGLCGVFRGRACPHLLHLNLSPAPRLR